MFKLALHVCMLALLAVISPQALADKLKPFSLASKSAGSLKAVTRNIKTKLENNGFEVIGVYKPYTSTRILVVTNRALKEYAANTPYGGFGAALKVAITEIQRADRPRPEIQVSYNNPVYIGLAFNMGSRMKDVKADLEQAIGFIRDFGGGEGIEESELPEYNYAAGLEDFFGFFEFADHGSYTKAIRKVEQGLANNNFGIKQVFRLDVPGKQQTVFGLDLQSNAREQPYLNDKFVMQVIDHQKLRRSAHLPYEIMVKDSKVISLHPHFRLAVNFPDLRMLGKHSFGQLIDLPYVYEEYFTRVVGGKWPREADIFDQ